MVHKQALEKLKVSLTDQLEAWIAKHCDTDVWSSLNTWVGDSLPVLMAEAAMAVFSGVVDCNDYLHAQDMLK